MEFCLLIYMDFFCSGDLLRAAGNLRVLVAGAVDCDALHQVAHAGVHRLPGQAHSRRPAARATRDHLLGRTQPAV